MDFSKKCVMIIDNGLFVELAVTLSKTFGKVYYHTPWVNAFPQSNTRLVGTGIPNVTRINDYWEVKDEVDLWVFPDIYCGGLQLELESQGKRVWGSRNGDELELYRPETKKYLKSVGVNIGKYEVITGMDNLREYLKENDDQYVKVSTTRGDMETFRSKNYNLIEPKLDELEYKLGAKKTIMQWVVEDAIKDAVEVGYDGYTVDGQFPKHAMAGIEIKDKSYLGIFKEYAKMPKQILDVNSKVSPALKEYGYKNFFCCEMRITKDGTPWVIDPMTRFGSPPGELVQNMYTNLAEILWFGAEGILIEPICEGKFGAEVLIHSSWADTNWQPIDFPIELRDQYKFRNLAIINNKYYVVPQGVGLPEIGAVVATGDTKEEAISKCKEYCEQIEGHYIETYADSLDEATEQEAKLKEFGITI
jgi:predicted RNase H-like HicB family nuclease